MWLAVSQPFGLTLPHELGAPHWNRTNASALRGARPATGLAVLRNWLGDKDSNLDRQIQSLSSCQLNDLPTEMVYRVGLEPTIIRKGERGYGPLP